MPRLETRWRPVERPPSRRLQRVEEAAGSRDPEHRAHRLGDRERPLGMCSRRCRVAERVVGRGDGEPDRADREPALSDEGEAIGEGPELREVAPQEAPVPDPRGRFSQSSGSGPSKLDRAVRASSSRPPSARTHASSHRIGAAYGDARSGASRSTAASMSPDSVSTTARMLAGLVSAV